MQLLITGIAPIQSGWAGAALVVIVGVVIFGGIKRLSDVASYIVPFMALAYILLALFGSS